MASDGRSKGYGHNKMTSLGHSGWFGCVLLACVLRLASPAAAQTPRDGAAYTTAVARVLAVLPPGTRHEFVMLPLRDGVRLATDVFIPEGPGPWAAMLLRTPYSRFNTEVYTRYDPGVYTGKNRLPCVTVVQNQRGRHGSEGVGTFDPLDTMNEVNDGYDTIEWIARQPWSTGKVGAWGVSGHGICPTAALWSGAPHLALVSTGITGDNLYLYWSFDNGARRHFYTWLTNRNLQTPDWPRPTTTQFDVDGYRRFVRERAARCQAFYRGHTGWFDLFSEAALDHFALLAPTGRAFVTVSADGHGSSGDFKFPGNGHVPAIPGVPTVKDILTGAPGQAKSVLVYYLMGDVTDPGAPGNRYMMSNVWPVPNTATSYYLHADGSLSLTAPHQSEGALGYVYDPKDPVPSVGGNWSPSGGSGVLDQRKLSGRRDILRFATEPLAEPVGITGKVRVELAFSTDVADTMFTVKLVDIYPDGYQAVYRESAGLARYFRGLDKPARLERGTVYKLMLDCWSTALVFNKGHRIGLHVSSSSHPAYQVHPNTYDPIGSEAECEIAHNTIHMTATNASRLILPVVPGESYAN